MADLYSSIYNSNDTPYRRLEWFNGLTEDLHFEVAGVERLKENAIVIALYKALIADSRILFSKLLFMLTHLKSNNAAYTLRKYELNELEQYIINKS